ncbi:lytic transglycosylase domain-containing protein [Anianabacter salinae]|uniref:lytic transglycosylase domain-containing protein n=1 Tax=Anianabacter salinae TaxID=2851023 RepID=UPI00225E3343|nr:lytic transglycosylase domain-containing protein [Anianabacter salinae]MBV0911971.1 lytic transglycosylase domain-containing protein [Anianabacter salinae]
MRACIGVFAAIAFAASAPAFAEGLNFSQKNRTALFKSQTSVLDRRASQQYAASVRLQPTTHSIPGKTAPYTGAYNGPYIAHARAAARKYGVPEDLFLKLVHQESRWNDTAESHKGAYGLAQLMPATASILGVDHTDPMQNLDGGARYLKMQYDRFGSWRLALAAYNAGPEAVERHGDIPPYKETQNYVKVIWGS